jgi:hypothetical protein
MIEPTFLPNTSAPAINLTLRSRGVPGVDNCKRIITCQAIGWLGSATRTRR